MRVHCVQQVDFEGPGALIREAAIRKWDWTLGRAWEGVDHPDPSGLDAVILLGGPMSVHDAGKLPWLREEMVWVEGIITRHRAGVPGPRLLGICLGAQILAAALGAEVRPNDHKEIGFFPVRGLPASSAAWPLPEGDFMAFHWHGETFSLPESAHGLARSEACEHQAFLWDDHVLGLQFHLETTAESMADLIAHGGDDLASEGAFVMDADRMGDLAARQGLPSPHLARVLDWLEGAPER